MKTNVLRIALATLLTLAAFGSCSREVPHHRKSQTKEITFVINISVPPTSKAIDDMGPEDNQVDEITILLFHPVTGLLVDYAQTSDITDAFQINFKRFTVNIPPGTYKALFMANAAADIALVCDLTTGLYTPAAGGTQIMESDIASKLQSQVAAGTKYNADTTSSGYKPFKMCSNFVAPLVIPTTVTYDEANPITLSRMVAKINVTFLNPTVASQLTLDEILLCNYNTNAYMVPAPGWWVNPDLFATSGVTQPVAIEQGLANAISYSGTDFNAHGACIDEIFTFEAPISATDHHNPCLIIKASSVTVGGVTHTNRFYKLDFRKDDNGVFKRINLLRNFSYTLTLSDIQNKGYASAQEAYNNEPEGIATHLVVHDDPGGLNEIVWGPFYYLAVDCSQKYFNWEGGSEVLKIFTDYSGGWTITWDTGDPGWLSIGTLYTLGPNTTTSNVILTATPNSGSSPRMTTFTVTAGTLKKEITVIQFNAPCIAVESVSIQVTSNGGTSVSIPTGTSTQLHISDITPSDATTPFTYQWQWFFNGIWHDIPDANGATFNAVAATESTTPYRLVVTNCGALVTSNTVSVTGTSHEPYISTIKTYVGAFWKYNQTGERLIRMTGGPTHYGAWSATVIVGDSWIELDKTMTNDLNVGWRTDVTPNEANVKDMNDPANDLAYRIAAGTGLLTVSGVMDANNPHIYFRIGLKSNNPSSTLPRYGVVLLTFQNHSRSQRIYIRQGEAPDYVPGKSGTTVKWSPYNVGNYQTVSPYNNGGFVAYPTQAGYFYQWGLSSGTAAKAYHPVNPLSNVPNWDNSGANYVLNKNVCPTGYRVPTGGTAGYYPNDIGYLEGVSIVWGYYADGFFDRRALNTSPFAGFSNTGTVVSLNAANLADSKNERVAYAGVLFYSTADDRSLFFPATGIRLGSSSYNGYLNYPGLYSCFWSQTTNTSGSLSAFYWYVPDAGVSQQQGTAHKSYGTPIRCVYP